MFGVSPDFQFLQVIVKGNAIIKHFIWEETAYEEKKEKCQGVGFD